MKFTSLTACIALLVCSFVHRTFADGTNDARAELKQIQDKINAEVKSGKRKEADLAPDIKQLDALLAEHKNEKTEDVARILIMKAMLYVQVFHETKKGEEILKQVKDNYPGTKSAKDATMVLDQLAQARASDEEAAAIQKTLTVGAAFPDFSVKDLAGSPLSLANYKGKIVLLDFWATWCGPCVQELPNVIRTYKHYHPQGFEIVGVSLDDDQSKLESFLRQKDMPWPQYFDGKGWRNSLAVKYGIHSIPATFLIDGEGKIIGKGLRGEELSEAVGKALAKK